MYYDDYRLNEQYTVMPCGHPVNLKSIFGYCAGHLFPIFWVSADWGFDVAFKLKNLNLSLFEVLEESELQIEGYS